VIGFVFSRPPEAADHELLSQVSDTLAVAIRSSKGRALPAGLFKGSRCQNDEPRIQQEHLQICNDELKRTNSKLQEQMQILRIRSN